MHSIERVEESEIQGLKEAASDFVSSYDRVLEDMLNGENNVSNFKMHFNSNNDSLLLDILSQRKSGRQRIDYNKYPGFLWSEIADLQTTDRSSDSILRWVTKYKLNYPDREFDRYSFWQALDEFFHANPSLMRISHISDFIMVFTMEPKLYELFKILYPKGDIWGCYFKMVSFIGENDQLVVRSPGFIAINSKQPAYQNKRTIKHEISHAVFDIYQTAEQIPRADESSFAENGDRMDISSSPNLIFDSFRDELIAYLISGNEISSLGLEYNLVPFLKQKDKLYIKSVQKTLDKARNAFDIFRAACDVYKGFGYDPKELLYFAFKSTNFEDIEVNIINYVLSLIDTETKSSRFLNWHSIRKLRTRYRQLVSSK